MERKIPTLVGLVLLVITVGIVAILFEFFTRTLSSASGSVEPKNVAFTNASDMSFTVTWFTANPATGLVSLVASGQKSLVAYDEREASGPLASGLGAYTSHSVPVSGLQPNTDYAIKILSNGKTYLDHDKPYLVRTGPILKDPPGGLGPAYGTITTNSLPATGAVVYLTVEGGQILSALVSKSGTWLIPLNLVRTSSLAQYLSAKTRLTETLRVVYNDRETNAITDTLNDSPVPMMEIGKTYDFRRQQAEVPSQPQVLGSQAAASLNHSVVSLSQPEQGAALPTSLPLFSGTGIAGKLVSLVIGLTNPISGTTTVAPDGTWLFTPPRFLDQGLQSVTMTTVDDQDRPVALTHTFTILKSGSQVLGIATPSATLTPTLAATPSPTSTLAGKPVPTSGTSLPTLLLILFGLAFLGSGVVMVTK